MLVHMICADCDDATEAVEQNCRIGIALILYSGREPLLMTTSKNRRVNAWHQRKHNQQPPHGRIKSFAELAEEPGTLPAVNTTQLVNEHAKQASQQLFLP